jgi:hypothetical protein
MIFKEATTKSTAPEPWEDLIERIKESLRRMSDQELEHLFKLSCSKKAGFLDVIESYIVREMKIRTCRNFEETVAIA